MLYSNVNNVIICSFETNLVVLINWSCFQFQVTKMLEQMPQPNCFLNSTRQSNIFSFSNRECSVRLLLCTPDNRSRQDFRIKPAIEVPFSWKLHEALSAGIHTSWQLYTDVVRNPSILKTPISSNNRGCFNTWCGFKSSLLPREDIKNVPNPMYLEPFWRIVG